MPKSQLSREELFWLRVAVGPDCWVWAGAITRKGYGSFSLGNRTSCLPHRYMYELIFGPIPDTFVIDHRCRTRSCVNPAHLEAITAAENNRRGLNGVLYVRPSACPKGHALTADNIGNRNDTRAVVCKICARAYQKAWRERQT